MNPVKGVDETLAIFTSYRGILVMRSFWSEGFVLRNLCAWLMTTQTVRHEELSTAHDRFVKYPFCLFTTLEAIDNG